MARVPNLIFSKTFLTLSRSALKRTLMTSSSRAAKAVEELEKNAYYEKYADKIAKLQKTSPEEFLSRVDQLDQKKTPPKREAPAKKDSEQVTEGKFSQLLNPKKPIDQPNANEETPLDKIMKIELVQDKSPEEIKEIWHQYHGQKDYISAVMPSTVFDELMTAGNEFPTFLFALPRNQGYEFVMSQFDKNSVHFTPLLYYQVHKENAPECLTITHFTELKESKNIVLMRGEYDSKVIDFKEAQCLANQLQLYYVNPDPVKQELLQRFTEKPDEFKYMDLIKQLETLSL